MKEHILFSDKTDLILEFCTLFFHKGYLKVPGRPNKRYVGKI